MNLRTALAAAAVLAVSTPALAQETPAQPEVEAPAREPTAEEIAFGQRAEAFDGRMQAMITEIQTMLADGATSGDQKTQALEVILANYSPEINGFANDLQAFLLGAQSRSTDPAEQAAIAEALAQGPAGVRSIPDQVRAGVAQAIAAEQARVAGAAAGTPPAQAGEGAVAGQVPVQ